MPDLKETEPPDSKKEGLITGEDESKRKEKKRQIRKGEGVKK